MGSEEGEPTRWYPFAFSVELRVFNSLLLELRSMGFYI